MVMMRSLPSRPTWFAFFNKPECGTSHRQPKVAVFLSYFTFSDGLANPAGGRNHFMHPGGM
jgi:hypothetical protein